MPAKIIDDLQLIELNANGYSDKDISELMEVNINSIRSRRIKLNLNPNRAKFIDRELFMLLYNQNFSDREICERTNKSFKSIQSYRLRLGLTPNKKNIDKMVIKDDGELIKLFNLGYSISEISEILKLNKITVGIHLRKIGLKASVRNRMMKIEPSEREKSIMIGTLLGDASMQKSGLITMSHSIKQLQYIEFKRELLKNISCSKIKYSERKDKRTEKVYFNVRFIIRSTEFGKNIFKHLYKGKKVISKEVLEYYNEEAMALHFMDDGCVCKPFKVKYHFFATDGFDYDSVNLLKNHMKEKFNLKARIQTIGKNRNHYQLCIVGKESNKNFENIIKPYCTESMYYKV